MAETDTNSDLPNVEHDQLIDFLQARISEEYERASDSSESAAKTRDFLEETSMNSQAVSWLKSIKKKLPKKDGQAKAMDIIRSLKVGLPLLEDHVMGQGTVEMDLGEEDTETDDVTTGDAEIDAETADFDDHADSVEDDTVEPFDEGDEVDFSADVEVAAE